MLTIHVGRLRRSVQNGTLLKESYELLVPRTFLLVKLELIFGKGMRTATSQFSESGGSVNGPNLFTELPFL